MPAMFDSLLRPSQIRTNNDAGLLRLIACVCMCIDHAGKMLFPELTWMRLVGRLAFPLFAYGIAVGAAMTKNPTRYLSRVMALALISQPLYAVALDHTVIAMYDVPFTQNPLLAAWNFYIESWHTPSILLSLFLGLAILLCLREKKVVLAIGLYVLCERFTGTLDYGVEGIRLILLFYIFLEHPFIALPAVTLYMLAWAHSGYGYPFFGVQFGMRIYALPAAMLACLPIHRQTRMPRWLNYGFYPAHLLILLILEQMPMF